MGRFLNESDFSGIGDADTLITDAEALAILAAPCLRGDELTEHQEDAARAILRGVISRWSEAGTGAQSQMSAGPFTSSPIPQARRNALWPSEVRDLQKICRSGGGSAFAINTIPRAGIGHDIMCTLLNRGAYCSCGANETGGRGPLYESGPAWLT